jgi:outer membrane protein, heavy metal efflux system
MRPSLLKIVTLLALSATCASADLVLTADSAARLARERNPELLAAWALVAEAESRARGSGRLRNPEVDLEVAGGQDSEGRAFAGLTQRFPLTARLRLERNLSALDLERARLEVRQKELQLAMAAREAFYELAGIREALSLAGRQIEAAKEIAESLTSSATEGFTSSLDAGQAALAGEGFAATQEALRAEEALAAGRLATLLGRSADTTFSIKDSLALPRTLPANRSIGFRPDLKLAEVAVQSGAADVSLAEAARWEDVGIGLFVEGERFRDEPDGIEPEALVGVRLSIPLPLWQNGSGKVAEKQAAVERQKQLLESLRLSALNQALAAHRAMSAQYRAASLADTMVLPAARKQVAETESAYQRGELDMQTLFVARERLAAFEASALEARKKFHLAHSEWLTAVGELEASQP